MIKTLAGPNPVFADQDGFSIRFENGIEVRILQTVSNPCSISLSVFDESGSLSLDDLNEALPFGTWPTTVNQVVDTLHWAKNWKPKEPS